jgi:hypothetical protein
LSAITLRNLSTSGLSTRRLSTALDDEALPQSLSTPAKLLSKQEQRKLEQSRSSTDLTSIHEKHTKDGVLSDGRSAGDTTPQTPRRPSSKRMRRRSTLEWVNASPAARQKRLENVTRSRLMDVFYSLHVENEEDPIYVSEIAEKTMNPTFRTFTLADCGARIMRLDRMNVKVWIRQDQSAAFECLIELQLDLQCLQYMGKTLESIKYPLPQNCILFHMTDGIYTVLGEGFALPPPKLGDARQPSVSKVLPTSSYDALMRLSNLDVSVQNAIVTRQRLEQEINDLLQSNDAAITTVQSVAMAEESLSTVEQAVEVERRRLEAITKRRNALKASIKSRETFMFETRKKIIEERTEILQQQQHIDAMKEAIVQTARDTTTQRRRICDDMQRVFPIDPIPSHSLSFTIRMLPLPNSVFDNTDDATVAAALGYVAQMVKYLSFYLSTPLPYPPNPRGSTSTISDPISASLANPASAVYPLYSRGTPRFRFEYAVFLLNKNIQLLAARSRLRVVDLRHTLPNLKYLLCVASARGAHRASSIRSVNSMRTFLRETSEGGSREESVDGTVNVGEAVQSLGSALAASRLHDGGEGSTNPKSKAGSPKENGVLTSSGSNGIGSQPYKGSSLRNVS